MHQQHFRNYLLSFIGLLIVYILLFLYVDKPLAYAIYHSSFPMLTRASKYISYLGEYKAWFALSIIGLLLIRFKLHEKHPLTANMAKYEYVFYSVLLAVVIGAILKFVLARYRPEMLFSEGLYGFHFFSKAGSMNSTPSGHSLCIFAVATSLSVLFRRYAVLFFTIAILVALSRLVVLKHYLSDVVLGAYIGVISAMLMKPTLRNGMTQK